MSDEGFNLGTSFLDVKQPRVPAEKVAAASGTLTAYRVMAFITGVVLLAGCISLLVQATMSHASSGYKSVVGLVWVGHGYLYLVYVVVAGVLGFKLRWPLARYVLVMLAGTIPTMSFVAEHYVTRATRAAAGAQPVPARD